MKYNIILESFEGPLDLLLNLISKTKIDIYDIPIHIITKQYMEYIYNMEKMNLEIPSDFLIMASTLIEIKSKMLLPKEKVIFEGEEFELDPRDELVKRILEYKKYKEAAEDLREFEKEKSKTYYKPKEDLTIFENESIDFNNFNLDLLISSVNRILDKKGLPKELNDIKQIKREEYKGSDCIDKILKELERKKRIYFNDLIDCYSEKNEIISYFLSLLELIRNKDILVIQESAFSDLIIEKAIIEE